MKTSANTVRATPATLESVEQEILQTKSNLQTSIAIAVIGVITQIWMATIIILSHLEK